MKDFFIFILFLLIGIGIVIIGVQFAVQNTNQLTTPLAKQSVFFVENAPNETLRGSILSLSGKVDWQSRVATQPALLTSIIPLQQGEAITTEGNGNISINFPNMVTISLSPYTEVSFVQALPTNFVMSQAAGSAVYNALSSNPITIRSLHLLVQDNSGNLAISTDQNNEIVKIAVKKGTATLGFNDTTNTSNIVRLTGGQTYTFDDTARTGQMK